MRKLLFIASLGSEATTCKVPFTVFPQMSVAVIVYILDNLKS